METKHTQGEWIHAIEKDGMYVNDVVKKNNQYIATIHVTGTDEEWKANAKLIAAAPDLLEALNDSDNLLREIKGGHYGKITDKLLAIINKHIEDNIAAIKKATE